MHVIPAHTLTYTLSGPGCVCVGACRGTGGPFTSPPRVQNAQEKGHLHSARVADIASSGLFWRVCALGAYHHTCRRCYTCTYLHTHSVGVYVCRRLPRFRRPVHQSSSSTQGLRFRAHQNGQGVAAGGRRRASTPASAGQRRGRLGRASPFPAQPASAEFAAPSIRCGSEGGRGAVHGGPLRARRGAARPAHLTAGGCILGVAGTRSRADHGPHMVAARRACDTCSGGHGAQGVLSQPFGGRGESAGARLGHRTRGAERQRRCSGKVAALGAGGGVCASLRIRPSGPARPGWAAMCFRPCRRL